jgi:predicted permease
MELLRFARHLFAALRRPALDDRLRSELDQHVAWRAQMYVDDGVPPAEARRRAAIDVGNVTKLREDARATWGFPLLDGIVQDLRYGVRMLRRSTALTIIAVASLAIGIGSSAAVFSLANAVLFRTLAVDDPDGLVVMKWFSGPAMPFESLNGTGEQSADGASSTSFSSAALDAFRGQGSRFVDVIAFADLYKVNIASGAAGEMGTAHAVSGNYFETLGVGSIAGRTLGAGDDRVDALPAIAISHSFARRHFARPEDAIDQTVSVNAVPFTVAGVLPASFHGTGQAGSDPDIYVPLALRTRVVPNDDPITDPNFWWVLMMGRLKPGARVEDAQAALDVLFKRTVAHARPQLAASDLPKLRLLPGSRGQVEDRAQMMPVIRTMAIVTIIVLVVACANVASLLLARGRARARELGVRLAIGATRARIVRQLLTEALLLAAAASTLGVLLARWMTGVLLPAVSRDAPVLLEAAGTDVRVLAFAVLVGTASAVVFGLLPAVRSTDRQLALRLEEARRSATASKQRRILSGSLVAIQIALTLLLAVAAGLLVRSLRNLEHVELGFDPGNLLLFSVDASKNGYDTARTQRLYADLLDRLRAAPGVRNASMSSNRLISGSSSFSAASRPEETTPDRRSAAARSYIRDHGVYLLTVDEQFFSTLAIPLVRGRAFSAADAGHGLGAVVNRSLARQLWGTEDVIGRRFRVGLQRESPIYEVIGICADARYTSLRRPMAPTAYTYYRQRANEKSTPTVAVKTWGPPAAAATQVREIVHGLDPTLPVASVSTQTEQIASFLERERLFARLALLLGLVALLLSAIGVYGLLAYSVVQRTQEIGIRMALGAAQRTVRWMVLRDSLVLAGIGLCVGVPADLAGTRLLDALLYGLPPRDALTLSAAAALMIGLALIAGYVPARRAARIDPMVALRAE